MHSIALTLVCALASCSASQSSVVRSEPAQREERASTGAPTVLDAGSTAAKDAGPAALDAAGARVAEAGARGEDAAIEPTLVVVALPDSAPLPRGVSLDGEPRSDGSATLVLHNGSRVALRVRAFAAVEAYVATTPSGSNPYHHVENAMLVLNEQCRSTPECITLAPGQTLRAPTWPGTQCPSVQCESTGCRHVGAGVYRFVVAECRGGALRGAPFRLVARPAENESASRERPQQ